jgi:hypothetical protein
MKFLVLLLCVLPPEFSNMNFSQSAVLKPDSQKSAAPPKQDHTAQEVILIGEMHGTQETPRLFDNLVTVAAREKNKHVAAGLELPISLQPLIDEAVKKDLGIDSFREQLLGDPAWQKINDGRSSQAMLDLICDLLRLAESQKVSFFFFDTEINDRNETMAKVIGQRAREQHYDATFILTGNIHANKAAHHPGRRQIVPMGHFLEEQGFAVHSYDVRYAEGETWACMPQCGVHHLEAYPVGIDLEGFDGTLFVGPVHASPPVQSEKPTKAEKKSPATDEHR